MRDDRRFWLSMCALVFVITLTLIFILARAEVLLPQGVALPGHESGKAAPAIVAEMGQDAPWGEVRTANLPPGRTADDRQWRIFHRR